MEYRSSIELYKDGSKIKEVNVTEEQWESVNYMDYVDLDDLGSFVDCFGEEVVKKALNLFNWSNLGL